MNPDSIQSGDLEALVPRILEDECEDPEGVIDDEMIVELIDTFRLIFAEKKAQLVKPYTLGDLRLIIHSEVVATQYHKGQERRAGEPYINHPRGARRSLITDLGRTRPTLVSSASLHDVMEDAREDRQLSKKEFIKILEANFKDPSHFTELKHRIDQIAHIVNALTKDYKGEGDKVDRMATVAATLRKLYKLITSVGPDPAIVRFADRRNNVIDYENNPKENRVHEIAVETYEVFARLANAFGLDLMAGIFTDGAARTDNPALLYAFDAQRAQRMEDRITPATERLRDILNPAGKPERKARFLEHSIADIQVVGTPLSEFSLRLDEPIADIEIEHLRISDVAPLARIDVIVHPDIEAVGGVSERVSAVVDHINRNFTDEGDSFNAVLSHGGDGAPNLGTQLYFSTKQFETVVVRVIDSVSHARARRGHIAVSDDVLTGRSAGICELPAYMRSAMGKVLNGSRHDERRVFPLSRELLYPNMITVYDRGGKEVSLPQGSTALDLAATVHPDICIGAVEARQILPKHQYIKIGLYDELKNGMRVEVISCLSKEYKGRRYDSSGVNDDPARMLYCRSEAGRSAVRSLLCAKKYPEKRDLLPGHEGINYNSLDRGRKYSKRVAELFGLSLKLFMKIIRGAELTNFKKANNDTLFIGIGRGTIEPISVLSATHFIKKSEWRIRVKLADSSGALHRFSSEFAEKGINIDHVTEHHKGSADTGETAYDILRLRISDEHEDRSPFDIMRSILKLSMDYDITIDEEPNLIRALAGQLGDVLIRASRPGGGD